MTTQQVLDDLEQLKQKYNQDCATLRLALYGKPWLLNPRLAERGEQYDDDTRRVLSQAGRGVTKYQIGQAAEEA